MNDKLAQYFNESKELLHQREQENRDNNLIDLGLYDKEYIENAKKNDGFEWDKERKQFFRRRAITVTDEEYAEIMKYADLYHVEPSTRKQNGIANALELIGVIGIAVSVLLAFSFLDSSALLGILYGTAGVILGIVFLGLGEVINKLDELCYLFKEKK